MAFIFDNLTANIIALTVILILASIQMRSTRQRVAQTSQQLVQDRARGLTAWLEKDLGEGVNPSEAGEIGGIGKNMSPSENALIDLTSHDGSNCEDNWKTRRFVFEWKKDDGSRARVKYETEEEKGLYSFTRKQIDENSGDWPEGSDPEWENVDVQGRASGMEYFDIDLMEKDGSCTSISDENNVRSVRARFSIEAPFQNEELAFSASRANTIVARYPL